MTIYLFTSLLLCCSYLALMLYYRYGYLEAQKHTTPISGNAVQPRFSIIIPARNEAENIGACLHSILQNDYPESYFEIILIDDYSTDETVAIAQNILRPPHRVLLLEDILPKDFQLNSYKKKALEVAIGLSSGEYIITTDADCVVSKDWLRLFAEKISETQAKFIAAPVDFVPFDKKTLLYYFQSIDFMTMQGITVSANRLRLGNMCNGANLCFSKAAFEAVDGYKGIDNIASGDDMMLMHKIANAYPEGIEYINDSRSIVKTPVQPTFHSFLNQRIRWASKADKYPQRKLTIILALVYFFNFNFLVLGTLAFFYAQVAIVLGIVFVLKVAAELLFLWPVAQFFHKRGELKYFVILQPLHILYIVAAGFLGKFGVYNWKGRIVK